MATSPEPPVGFSEAALVKKLSDLNPSAKSIEQLSLWIVHHRKHARRIVKIWSQELWETTRDRKLTLLYLANDVVQSSRKKHPEIAKEFNVVIKKTIKHMASLDLDEKTAASVGRLLGIWKDRQVFDPKIQTGLDLIWTAKTLQMSSKETELASPEEEKEESSDSPSPKKARLETDTTDSALYNPTTPEMSPTAATPPDYDDLIEALEGLQHAASSDAKVREEIARLPPEVSDASHLSRLTSVDEARALSVKVDCAMEMVDEYNVRLDKEMKDRKRASRMVKASLAEQRNLQARAEEKLEFYRDKLRRMDAVRDELVAHVESLPDLESEGLPPLPSADDLFTKK